DGIRDGHVTGVQTCALPIFGVGLPLLLLRLQYAQPGLNGTPGVFGFQTLRLVFELLKPGHVALKIRTRSGADKRNLLSTRRLRHSRPSSMPPRASLPRHTPRGRPGTRAPAAPDPRL